MLLLIPMPILLLLMLEEEAMKFTVVVYVA